MSTGVNGRDGLFDARPPLRPSGLHACVLASTSTSKQHGNNGQPGRPALRPSTASTSYLSALRRRRSVLGTVLCELDKTYADGPARDFHSLSFRRRDLLLRRLATPATHPGARRQRASKSTVTPKELPFTSSNVIRYDNAVGGGHCDRSPAARWVQWV